MEIKTPFDHAPTDTAIVRWFGGEIKRRLPDWQVRLAAQPGTLSQVELEQLAFVRELAQRLLAATLIAPVVQASVQMQGEQLRKQAACRSRKVYARPRRVVFLCGLVLTMICCYCAPRRCRDQRGIKRGVGRRGKEGAGLYPEFAALGITEGVSPALQSEVARQAALLPSLQLAKRELARHGVDLDIKTVGRVAREVGQAALEARRREVERFRRGELPVGDVLKGLRVAVAIDGGRLRLIEHRPGKRSRTGRRQYKVPWREPLVATIYVLDAEGNADPHREHWIEATMQDADHIMELVALRLHQLGAAQAERVQFLGDGAPWIWDRIDTVVTRAGIDLKRVRQTVDFYHVMENIAAGLDARGLKNAAHQRELNRLRQKIRLDEVAAVIDYFERGAQTGRGKKEQRRVAAYLRKHRERMHYPTLRRTRLPIGSGAVESAIRRVVNLRLKAPGTFWLRENAECFLVLRAAVLTGRWEELMAIVQAIGKITRQRAWEWEPQNYSNKPGASKRSKKTEYLHASGVDRHAA